MKERMKKVVALTAATVMAVSLAACGGQADNSSKDTGSSSDETTGGDAENNGGTDTSADADFSGQKITIGAWGGNDQESAALDKMIKGFEESTGADVELKVYTDYNTQIQADFVADTAPDAFYIDGSMFPFYSRLGVMEPLDKTEMEADKYYENLLDAFTAEDGTLYCIPKDVSTLATYYNTDLLESVGVKPEDIPDALEDYKAFLKDLQAKLDAEHGEGQIAAMTYNMDMSRNLYILEADGDSIIDEEGKAQLSQPGIVKNLEFMTDLVAEGCWQTPKDLGLGWNGEAFGAGKAAIMEEGNWVYTTLKNDYDVNFGVKEMPTYKGTQYSMAFTVGWGISAKTEQKDLAKAWVKYATGTDGMEIWCSGAGCLPSRADVAESMDVESDPVWKVHSDMTAIATPWQKGTTIDIINSNYQNFGPSAFKGEATAEEAMKKVDDQANSEIANAQ
ncbi:MAG: extracellular solute-binding protein [Eubacterium sp.]|nr:extracellular solute-binding protein [Eubacterium sp.]